METSTTARPLYSTAAGGRGGGEGGGNAAAAPAAQTIEETKPFYATAAPAFWSYYYDAKAERRQLGQTHPCLSPTSTCSVAQGKEQQYQQQHYQQQQARKQLQQQQWCHLQAQRQVQQQQQQQQPPPYQVTPRWLQQEMEEQEQQQKLNSLLAQSLYDSIKDNFSYILQTQYNYGFDNQGNIWRAYGYAPVPLPRRFAQPHRN